MNKLTAAQSRVVDQMKAGAFIRWSGYGQSGRDVLHIPRADGVADYETKTIPSVMMGVLVRSGAIKRVGHAFSRDSKWVAA